MEGNSYSGTEKATKFILYSYSNTFKNSMEIYSNRKKIRILIIVFSFIVNLLNLTIS